MSTTTDTVAFILDQLSGLKAVSARKMFGEYALYNEGRVVGLVCNDTLYVKMTEAGAAYLGANATRGPAYPGAKDSFVISGDLVEDREWLSVLLEITTENVSPQKVRLKKRGSKG